MSQINIEPISKLCQQLDDLCPEPVASSIEVAQELVSNPAKRLAVSMKLVKPLPKEVSKTAMEAMKIWYEIFIWFSLTTKYNRVQFLKLFHIIREDFLNGGESWQARINPLARQCEEVVWNISWVDAFTWQLPAADPVHKPTYLDIGEMMMAIMWLEGLGKIFGRGLEHSSMLAEMQGIEARCQIVYQQLKEIHS